MKKALVYLLVLIIACVMSWRIATDKQASIAQKTAVNSRNSALKTGQARGYNEAFGWMVQQCKKGTTWIWEGDATRTRYICRREALPGIFTPTLDIPILDVYIKD